MSAGQDYPDYQSYANWRSPVYAYEALWPLSAANPFTQAGYLTNYQSLVINAGQFGADGGTVSVEFYSDNTLSQNLFGYSWAVAQTQALHVIVPILGNYAVFTVTTPNAATVDTFIEVQPMNTPVQSPRYINSLNFVAGQTVSIPLSTTRVFPFPNITEGPGTWFISDPAVTGKFSARISFLDRTASEVNYLQYITTVGANNTGQFYAPNSPIGFVIQNTDTANHNITFALVVDGR